MSECATLACDRPARTRGYCDRHYRRRLHTGRYGYRDAEAARQHVRQLRDLGWTWAAIGEAAGLSAWVGHRLGIGQTKRLWCESEVALLAIPLTPLESHRGVSAVGSQRRVQALAWMGWPNHEIATRAGCSPRSLPTLLARGRLSTALALRIAAVYEELSMVPGPSKHAATKARQRGCLPPLAWDDDDLNNPDAQPWSSSDARAFDPIAVERIAAGTLRLNPWDRSPERVEAVRRLAALGFNDAQISVRVGMTAQAVGATRKRHGIPSASKGAVA